MSLHAPLPLSGATQDASWARMLGLAYAWAGILIMWAFWVSFVIFLAQPKALLAWWPLPTVDRGGWIENELAAAAIDLVLIALFGLQHSVMARPWFKAWWAANTPPAFERCTYVHMANIALFALILFWQPLPIVLWEISAGGVREAVWALFALGWVILLAGGWSFGMSELLGLDQMRRWASGRPPKQPGLKTGQLYQWVRHPMYVGVLLGVWVTPTMTFGHALLAMGLTAYVLIAMRYEERDLTQRFGTSYRRWRAQNAG